jgi:hypothetical protein
LDQSGRTQGNEVTQRTFPWWLAIVSTVNIIQFQIFGWLSIPANQMAYWIEHGDGPEEANSRGWADWVGVMPFPLPWGYFALTGLIVLAVAVLAIPRASQYATTRRAFRAWRTTPNFLVSFGILMTLELWLVSRFYDAGGSAASLYLIGAYAAGAGILVSLVTAYLQRRPGGVDGSPSPRQEPPAGAE